MFPCGTVMLKKQCGTSLVVQWLRFSTPDTAGMGSIPGWGTKIPHDAQNGLKKKKRQLKKRKRKSTMCIYCVRLLRIEMCFVRFIIGVFLQSSALIPTCIDISTYISI